MRKLYNKQGLHVGWFDGFAIYNFEEYKVAFNINGYLCKKQAFDHRDIIGFKQKDQFLDKVGKTVLFLNPHHLNSDQSEPTCKPIFAWSRKSFDSWVK